jgi:hypothetical protein
MSIPPFATNDRAQIITSTIVDGCVGETASSVMFQEAARVCAVPSLAALYRTIAEEEAQHAVLAFRIVHFMKREADEDLVAIALGASFDPESRTPAPALGILGEEAQQTIHQVVLSTIVVPALAAASSSLQDERRPAFFG